MKSRIFKFKQFEIADNQSAMKIGTDGVILGAWADVTGCQRILDIGTGTGLIALMLAQRNIDAYIEAVEIEKHAFEEAQQNFTRSPWPGRLHAIHTDIKAYKPSTGSDLVVSNPPFFTSGTQSPVHQRHKARHTQSLNLSDLISISLKVLSAKGRACFILPPQEGHLMVDEAKRQGLYLTKKTTFRPKVSKNIERVLLQFEKNSKPLTESTLIHYKEDGSWSADYISLTKDFHPML